MPEDKVNILLVDDREDGLMALKAVLSRPDYNLVTASSGADALVHLLHQNFAVILLDVQMPVMDGFEVAALIKQRERSKHIPIIFVTAINKDSRYVYRGYELGAIDYLFKPFDPQILTSKVSVFVELFKRGQQLETQAELLRQSEEKNRLLVDNARDIIVSLGPDGSILSLNPAFETLLKHSRAEWLGKKCGSLIHPEDVNNVRNFVRRALCQESVLFEARVLTRDREYARMEFSADPLLSEGEAKGLIMVARDISERRRGEEQRRRMYELERSNRDLEEFAFVCSHDLQEPLRVITSFAQLLERRYSHLLDEKGVEILGYITGGIQRMSRLIRDLLEISRLGAPGIRMEKVSCAKALHDAMDNLQPQIAETTAIVDVDPDLPAVTGNHSQITQLFQNILGNALKFRMGERPHIRVTTTRDNDEWIFSVTDNGIGFKMEYADRIFDTFKRLHSREAYDGTGVGLAACKRIVERHGGRIWATSRPEQGSTFYFTIPFLREELNPDAANEQTPRDFQRGTERISQLS